MKPFRPFSKQISICCFFGMLFFYPFSTYAQEALDGIAKIIAKDMNGNEIESGSGIVAGSFSNKLFIVTAYHVVAEAPRLFVKLQNLTGEEYPARLHYDIEEQLDIAVVIFDVPPNVEVPFHKFKKARLNKLDQNDELSYLGHPNNADWTINSVNSIRDPLFSQYEIVGGGVDVKPGFSGGAALSRAKGHLIGMITEARPEGVVIIKSNVLVQYLERWLIPTNFIKGEPLKNATFVYGGASLASFGTGLLFNSMAADKFDTYAKFRDETAPIYLNGMSRNDFYDEGKKFATFRNISYVASGILVGTAILVNVIRKKEPIYTTTRRTAFFINPSSFQGNSILLGMNLRF